MPAPHTDRSPDPDTAPAPAAAAPARGLGRVGGFCARRPWLVIGAWLVVLVLAFLGRHAVDPVFSDQVSLPGSQSATGASLLKESHATGGGASGRVVFHVDGGSLSTRQQAVDEAVAALRTLPHAQGATAPVVSADGRTSYTTVAFDEQPKSFGTGYRADLDRATAPASADGVQVSYGGDLDQVVRPKANDRASEGIGVLVALLLLLVGFGSVAAALLPLATAVVSVGTGVALVGVVGGVVTFSTSSTTLATMIGLGVGIDYALFLTTRFRQDLMDGQPVERAAARTTATSGRAVLVAAVTVAVAMLSLYACGLSFIGKLGFAATLAVVVTAAAALTLVPAALGLVGPRIDRLKVRRRPVAESSGDADGWHRYAALVSRHPWRFLVAGVALLAVCAAPLLSMRLGHVDDSADPAGSSTRTAYTLIADGSGPGFGPGANGPLTAVVDLRHATVPAAQLSSALGKAVATVPDVSRATPFTPTPDGRLLVSTVTLASGPQQAATATLFSTLKDDTLPTALRGTGAHGYLTGSAAGQLDFRDTVTARLPIIIALVLVASFLLLLVVFRSLVIPLKAVLMNLLTTGAAYGVLVAAFQWGWGRQLLGLPESVPIESYVPMMVFAISFGLSMDYEIFLLSRISEGWQATRDNTRAVGSGLAATGRVISSAALIMTAVFLSFTGSPTVVVKMLAFGLAVAVALDATVVRLVLVPAVMFLLGRGNWWLPRWLDRRLPHLTA